MTFSRITESIKAWRTEMATQSEMTQRDHEHELATQSRIDELLKSMDGVTSPISLTRGPVAGTFEVIMTMTSKGVELVEEIANETGTDWETVLSRALVLYKK